MKASEYIGVFILIGIFVNQLIFLTGTVLNKDSFNQYMSAVLSGVLIDQTNQVRQDKNLIKLKSDSRLQEAAQLKANDMAEKEYFSHISPDGKQPWYWLEYISYPYLRAGENLAVNFIDSSQVIQAWMESPSHRDNILNGNYTNIGIATAQGKFQGKDAVYVVQFFATPDVSKNIYSSNTEEGIITEEEVEIISNDTEDKKMEEVVDGKTVVYTEEELLRPFIGVLGAQDIAMEISEADEVYISSSDKFLSVPFKVTVGIFSFLLVISFLYGLRGIYLKVHTKDEEFSIIHSSVCLGFEVEDYRYLKQGFLLIFIIILFTYLSSLLVPVLSIG